MPECGHAATASARKTLRLAPGVAGGVPTRAVAWRQAPAAWCQEGAPLVPGGAFLASGEGFWPGSCGSGDCASLTASVGNLVTAQRSTTIAFQANFGVWRFGRSFGCRVPSWLARWVGRVGVARSSAGPGGPWGPPVCPRGLCSSRLSAGYRGGACGDWVPASVAPLGKSLAAYGRARPLGHHPSRAGRVRRPGGIPFLRLALAAARA